MVAPNQYCIILKAQDSVVVTSQPDRTTVKAGAVCTKDADCGERKEMFYLTTHSTHLVTVIWRRTYGKRPPR